ncbi:unnamed protein product [Mytilus coruscus]|uniref:DZIP3-like HEPN domain-containing protein n=1 Tax=Mytilus coruscus TaxID=42192 RepID=A0A6J8BW49_MYTCO|nr:unnamed protein product [Mytilus coruscus]
MTFADLFVKRIKDVSCTVGQTAVFKCQVRVNVQLTWYYYNTKVKRSKRFDFFSEDNVHELKITDVTFEDRGNYSSKANNVECKASLIVEGNLPEIHLKPFCFGENIVLQPTYDAYALEWYKDEPKNGPDDNRSKILEIKSASFENEGIYFAKFDHRVITVEMHILDQVLLTKEDANYLLIVNLILRRALPAVRHIFDKEFHPSKLYDIIIQNKVKLNDLKRKRHINLRQWNLLSKTKILHEHGLSIPYDQVLEVSAKLRDAAVSKYMEEGVFQTFMRKRLFTKAAIDNIDPNPTTTTAITSFQGTSISLSQYPSAENTGETISSKNFDLRLLICILRNIEPRINVIDDLPEPSNRSVEANLSRIKYFRNTIAHNLDHGRLLDKQFHTIWEDLRTSITELSTIPTNEKVNKVGQEITGCTSDYFATTLTRKKYIN